MEQSHTLIRLLRCAVTGEKFSADAETDWNAVWKLARLHHAEAMMYYALRGGPELPEELRAALDAAHCRAVFQGVQQETAAARIREALIAAEVPHVLLRGALMRKDYPYADMRTMADLDYLVRTEDYPAIRKAVEALGGRHVHTDGGHFTLELPPAVQVEFHPNLIYVASPVGTAINPGWQYVRPDSGPYALELSEEGFYLNMLCHLAYHFANGGTGVRSVLDVWVYRHRHERQADMDVVSGQLERAGLLAFARKIEALSEAWFGGGPMTDELEQLGSYILSSGTYGTLDRAVLNAACFSEGRTGLAALASKAFYPREELENRFPWAKGRPWLLPAAWCLRAAKAVTRHGKHIRRWRQRASALSGREIAEQRDRLRQFGLEAGRKDRAAKGRPA